MAVPRGLRFINSFAQTAHVARYALGSKQNQVKLKTVARPLRSSRRARSHPSTSCKSQNRRPRPAPQGLLPKLKPKLLAERMALCRVPRTIRLNPISEWQEFFRSNTKHDPILPISARPHKRRASHHVF